jgi:hypothetical protein
VVRFGGRTAIFKASIRTQPVFRHFEVLKLETSMRQGSDPAFSSFLDSIGDDHLHASVDLGRLNHTQSIRELINFVFPPTIVADPAVCIMRAILSPFNAFVDEFNSTILGTVPGEAHCYVSSDSIEDSSDGSNGAVFTDPEFLNSLKEPGIPPHELLLKIGAICRLTRNFDASRGLTKNTRVIVRNLLRHTVEVETISSVVAGRVVDPVGSVLISQPSDSTLTDAASHSPHQLPFSTSGFRIHSPSKTDTSRSVLRNDVQWLSRSNRAKIGP